MFWKSGVDEKTMKIAVYFWFITKRGPTEKSTYLILEISVYLKNMYILKNVNIWNFENRVFGDLGALYYFIRVRRVKLDAISREEIDFEHHFMK